MQESTGDGAEIRAPNDTELTDWVLQNVHILVVGDESSCKARFISNFLGTGIDRDPASESGFKKNLQFDDKSYCISIHTNVGQESILGACDTCMRHTQAAIFIYNIFSRESFLLFGGWRDRLHRELEHMPIALVGCADRMGEDVHTREVTTAEARKMAEACGGSFFEIGSTENNPIKEITECFAVLLQRITSSKTGFFEKPTDDPDQQKYTELEIVVCGDVFVGKTQLIRQLLAMPFQSQYNATLDSNVHKHKAVIQDVGFILKLVDVGGLDLDSCLNRDALMTAQGFVLVYGANSRESFNALEGIRKKIQQSKIEARIPIVMVANKTDLVRQVSRDEGSALAKRWACAYFETCAQSPTSHDDIAECFEVLISDIQHLYAHVPILDTIGDLDRQGYLGKEGNTFKQLNRRYFTLKDCTLSYSNDVGQSTKDAIFLIDNATAEVVVDAKKEGFPFVVSAGDERFSLSATSEAERDVWMASIKANLSITDVANSLLDEVMRAMLWEACAKMSEVVRRRIVTGDEPSTPPKSPALSLPSTPSGGLLGTMLGTSLGGGEPEDFMVPVVHDLSSSPSASPPAARSSPAMYKSKSFFRSSSKEKK